MNKRNYQKELETIIENIKKESRVPRLLLHSCCAPCSSYVLECLSQYFAITVVYYNPNISPREEYVKRVKEQRKLIEQLPAAHPIAFIAGDYEPERFYEEAKGLEKEPEGGKRCFRCFRLRLSEAARMAKAGGYDYFTTTLTISPLKNAETLNEIGKELAGVYQVAYLPSDFKKKNGYQRSVALSGEYGLYRQNYCGCVFSRQEQERREGRQAQDEAVVI